MAKMVWDQIGERLYETGVKDGALYLLDAKGAYSTGVPWNGLISVEESPSGAEASKLYADDQNYLTLYSAEEHGFTIGAYTYPDEFAECDGSASLEEGIVIGQQTRKTFGFAYKTTLGNDTENEDHGYKLHLVYGCKASPSSKSYNTINDSPEAVEFSWEVSTTPVAVTDKKPTATVVIDSTKITPTALAKIEAAIYGSTDAEPYLPLPDALLELIKG